MRTTALCMLFFVIGAMLGGLGSAVGFLSGSTQPAPGGAPHASVVIDGKAYEVPEGYELEIASSDPVVRPHHETSVNAKSAGLRVDDASAVDGFNTEVPRGSYGDAVSAGGSVEFAGRVLQSAWPWIAAGLVLILLGIASMVLTPSTGIGFAVPASASWMLLAAGGLTIAAPLVQGALSIVCMVAGLAAMAMAVVIVGRKYGVIDLRLGDKNIMERKSKGDSAGAAALVYAKTGNKAEATGIKLAGAPINSAAPEPSQDAETVVGLVRVLEWVRRQLDAVTRTRLDNVERSVLTAQSKRTLAAVRHDDGLDIGGPIAGVPAGER